MSDPEQPGESAPALTAEMVADYLRRHPEFFNDHPELVAEIAVPHGSGDAVSLVERQVRALREQNEETRKRPSTGHWRAKEGWALLDSNQ